MRPTYTAPDTTVLKVGDVVHLRAIGRRHASNRQPSVRSLAPSFSTWRDDAGWRRSAQRGDRKGQGGLPWPCPPLRERSGRERKILRGSTAPLPPWLMPLSRRWKGMAGTVSPANATRGRKPVHDRDWAHAALLDEAMLDPDGLPDRRQLIEALHHRFEAAGRPVPGETWMKNAVRTFLADAAAFEAEAVARFRASTELQAVFLTEAEFLRFRRARRRADAILAFITRRSGAIQTSTETHGSRIAQEFLASEPV